MLEAGQGGARLTLPGVFIDNFTGGWTLNDLNFFTGGPEMEFSTSEPARSRSVIGRLLSQETGYIGKIRSSYAGSAMFEIW